MAIDGYDNTEQQFFEKIPNQLLSDLGSERSWKQRSSAIETIERMLTEAIHKRESAQLGFGGRMNKEVEAKR